MIDRKTLILLILGVMIVSACSINNNNIFALKNDNEKILVERVHTVWTAMKNDDRGTWYDYYDPFFKSRITRVWWIGNITNIKYHNYEIKDLKIEGNIAQVQISVIYSIKMFSKNLGRVIALDNKEKVITETWLFIDGNWYRQFYDGITDGSFVRY